MGTAPSSSNCDESDLPCSSTADVIESVLTSDDEVVPDDFPSKCNKRNYNL